MKEKILKDYLKNGILNIDEVIDDFYNYTYTIIKNAVSSTMTNEDMEEILSDVFVGIWKCSSKISLEIQVKPYLIGITRNVIKNKYRKINLNDSILDYEGTLFSNFKMEEIIEQNEQDKIIQNTLKTLKTEEYKTFIMFYYEAKSIKEIAKTLNLSTSNVKVILHRVRKKIKKSLEDGGYSYGK